MLSLKERVELLERDLLATPPRVSVYRDLPFAILRYDPSDEWEVRREQRLLKTRLEQHDRRVHLIPMSDFLWQAIDQTEGLDAIVELERQRGFVAAQEQVTTYLADPDWSPLPDMLAERLSLLDPKRDVAFLVRAGAMAPALYRVSHLLEEMHGRTLVTSILFYPGGIEGTTGLRFMDLQDRAALGSYRVKVYA